MANDLVNKRSVDDERQPQHSAPATLNAERQTVRNGPIGEEQHALQNESGSKNVSSGVDLGKEEQMVGDPIP
jgi:hypothetical protein